MININLLPRQYLRRSGSFNLGKNGLYVLGVTGGVILMLAAVTLYQRHQMSQLNAKMEIARSRTMQLQRDIKMVDALIDIKAKITNRMEAVESLDRHRSAWVRILEDLTRNVPEFVWLSSFQEVKPKQPAQSQTGKNVNTAPTDAGINPSGPTIRQAEIEGLTFTLNALASFMIKMMKSNYFEDIDLIYSKEMTFGKQRAYNFKLSCNVHYLSDEELEKIVSQQSDSTQANIN
ncbi:MAG: PilN domain-containing protein [candidate division Zixibacteria bacterium]|nr:PilN domain-containing protein [candidate division Zixibacteria bacterium]